VAAMEALDVAGMRSFFLLLHEKLVRAIAQADLCFEVLDVLTFFYLQLPLFERKCYVTNRLMR
jgi:hypothetical protein